MSSESTVIQFWINDEKVEAPVADSDTPLLNYLRDSLGLNRARYGCGAAACGACTVICNGEAVTSCDRVLSELHGVRVETPESLGSEAQPHYVFATLIKHHAVQCGYCISGIAMRVKALLDKNPNPSKQSMDTALDHHLCRCGTHVRIKRAVYELAGIEA